MKIKNIIVENYNHEYDDEAGMAETNLVTIARAAQGLLDTIEDHENLPEWVQEKIAKVEGMMVTAWNYLESQEAQGVAEDTQRIDSLVTDALRIMRGAESNDAVQALKTVLGDREYNGRRGHYNFYVRQLVDMYRQQSIAEQTMSEGMPVDTDMGATTGGTKMTLGQWKQMWMKKMPGTDTAAMFRSPPNMQGSAIAYFDGWMNNPDARWNPQQGMAEGWQEDSQELEDWSKEVNKKLYRAQENQRRSLAIQLSKLEQKHFGSELTNGPLTNIVFSTLQALNKGQMVHYDPQSVGQMPFGSIVGDDARIIAASGLSKYDVDGYRGLQRAGIVDTIQQFLHLRDLANNKGQAILKYANMPPVAAWMQFIKDIDWSKDDMNEEVQAKTDDKLLAYYAQRKAEKQKQQQGMAEDELGEGWKEKLGGAALAGAMALGAGGAQARVTPDGQGGFTGGLKPTTTQQATDTALTQSTSSFSIAKPQAQYDVDTRILTYKGKQYKWNSDAQATGQGEVVSAPSMAVGSRSMSPTKVELNPNGTYTKVPVNEVTGRIPDPQNYDSDWDYYNDRDAKAPKDDDADYENMIDEPNDWFDESRDKVGHMDADAFDAAIARMKKLAGAGPLKTVYDPTRRVYKNVPTAQQPAKQPQK